MSTCFISTLATLMPHESVCTSSVCWMSMLSFSRCESISSRSCLPRTERSVVCASCDVAIRKFSTSMMAFCGSTTRKYTTAFTFTETLSREITSWLGTSSTTVRSSTRTICWMPGIRTTRPGPLTFQKRPSWNTTPRWYSRSTRSDDVASSTSRKMTINGPISAIYAPSRLVSRSSDDCSLHVGVGCNERHERFHADDANLLPAREPRRGAYLPRLAANVRPARFACIFQHFAVRAYQRADAADDRRPARAHGHADDRDDEGGGHEREQRDQRARNAETGNVGIDQHQRADHEGGHPAEAERAVRRHEDFGHHEREARIIDRKQVQRVEPEQQRHRARHAGKHETRMAELEDQPVNTEQHQDHRHARIGNDGERAEVPVRLECRDRRAGEVQHALAARDAHLAPFELVQEVLLVGRDHFDDLLFFRLGCREAGGFRDRLLSPFGVAPAQLRQAADVCGGILHRLALVDVGGRAFLAVRFGGSR